jgi:hypothetical protein
MLSFFNFLLEETNPTDKPKKVKSDVIGKVHEFLVHRNLGGKATPQEIAAYKKHKQTLGRTLYNAAVIRAQHASDHIEKHLIGRKGVSRVERVSGTGNPQDPSDLHIHFKNGKKIGISLKTTQSDSKEVKLSNPGLAAVNSIHNKTIKRDPDRQQHLWNIAHEVHHGFNNSSPQEKQDYLKKHVFRVPDKLEVYGVHTVNQNKTPATAHFKYHDHFTPLINGAQNITTKRTGNTVNFFHPSSKKAVASLRMKYRDAEENSPIKEAISTNIIPNSFYKQ